MAQHFAALRQLTRRRFQGGSLRSPALVAYHRRCRQRKKGRLLRSQAPFVQINSSNTSGITSFSTSASIKAGNIFITENPKMSTNTYDARCAKAELRGRADSAKSSQRNHALYAHKSGFKTCRGGETRRAWGQFAPKCSNERETVTKRGCEL